MLCYNSTCREKRKFKIPYKVIAYSIYKISYGELAQLGARLTGSQKVRGSNPLFSTIKRTEKSGFLFMWHISPIVKSPVFRHVSVVWVYSLTSNHLFYRWHRFMILGNILAVNSHVLLPNICGIYLELLISVVIRPFAPQYTGCLLYHCFPTSFFHKL